jgi:hypothetical protein
MRSSQGRDLPRSQGPIGKFNPSLFSRQNFPWVQEIREVMGEAEVARDDD